MSAPITPSELEQIKRDVAASVDRWALGGHVPQLVDALDHFMATAKDNGRNFNAAMEKVFEADRTIAQLRLEVELLRGYAWALDMIEGLVDKYDDDVPGPVELDPPWRLDMYVGEDADTIPVEGRTLLDLLLAYYERIGPAPGDPADDLDETRAKIRALIADRQAKAEAEGEAFLAKMRAAQAST